MINAAAIKAEDIEQRISRDVSVFKQYHWFMTKLLTVIHVHE